MNKSTKIMFLIGLICNVLEIVALIVGIIALSIAVGASEQIYNELIAEGDTQFSSPEQVQAFCVSGVVSCVFGLLISIAILICSRFAKKAQEKQTSPRAWPIVMIVLGALNNIFYMVAGILCLVENTQQPQQQPTKIEEQPAPKKARAKKTEK